MFKKNLLGEFYMVEGDRQAYHNNILSAQDLLRTGLVLQKTQ
jgi:hypothetical protein